MEGDSAATDIDWQCFHVNRVESSSECEDVLSSRHFSVSYRGLEVLEGIVVGPRCVGSAEGIPHLCNDSREGRVPEQGIEKPLGTERGVPVQEGRGEGAVLNRRKDRRVHDLRVDEIASERSRCSSGRCMGLEEPEKAVQGAQEGGVRGL